MVLYGLAFIDGTMFQKTRHFNPLKSEDKHTRNLGSGRILLKKGDIIKKSFSEMVTTPIRNPTKI